MNTTIAQQIANEGGVEAYLHAQQHKSLLRFLTCGSVDDGKSTLIGRLLHDTRQIYEDQLSSLHNDSKRHGTQGEKLDLALLVDGLQAEREQGITIDYGQVYSGQGDETILNQIGAQVVADGVDVIIPVATTAVGNSGATNAGLLAVQMLSAFEPELADKLEDYRNELKEKVAESNAQLV